MHRDAEQATLRVADHRKRDEGPIDQLAVWCDDPHVAGLLLREQQRAVGQERHVRREREIVEERPRLEARGRRRGGEGRSDQDRRDRESGVAHPSTVSRDGTMAGFTTRGTRCTRSITRCWRCRISTERGSVCTVISASRRSPAGCTPDGGPGTASCPSVTDYIELIAVVDHDVGSSTSLGRALLASSDGGRDRWFAVCLSDTEHRGDGPTARAAGGGRRPHTTRRGRAPVARRGHRRRGSRFMAALLHRMGRARRAAPRTHGRSATRSTSRGSRAWRSRATTYACASGSDPRATACRSTCPTAILRSERWTSHSGTARRSGSEATRAGLSLVGGPRRHGGRRAASRPRTPVRRSPPRRARRAGPARARCRPSRCRAARRRAATSRRPRG